jgi:hypothetical protein
VRIRVPPETVKVFQHARRGVHPKVRGCGATEACSAEGGQDLGEKRQPGDRFPSLTLTLADGGTIRLPEAIPPRDAAVLFDRGHW